MENIEEFHKRKIFEHYWMEIRCPKCNSEEVVIKTDDGYFWICQCRKCGYRKGF